MEQEQILELGKLIKSITDGDCTAIGEIYRRVGRIMHAIAFSYLDRKCDSDDVVNDALIKIVKKAYMFRENKNAYAWIMNIVKNIAKNRRKKISSRKEVALDETKDAYIEFDNTKIYVNEIFSMLSKTEADYIYYKYWFGLSYTEISVIVHKPRTTIKYTLDAAIERLRKFYLKD